MAIQRIDDVWEQGTYLNFRDVGKPNPKAATRIYYVSTRHRGENAGEVRWYAQWRQYTFWPSGNMIFDGKCLTELAEYCKLKTAEHKGMEPA